MSNEPPTLPTPDQEPPPSDQSSLKGLTMAVGIQPADPGHDPLLGRDIGGVTIVRLIAEGGMGRVYEGLQDSPKRKVAVKVMRPGFVSRETSQRFAMELEILGRLRHPYIAQIYSAGMCDVVGSQVPFFIMEYIPDALSLTRHAQEKMLGIDARIALFQKVCEAVAHGHEQGIVHRDLKPSNILVEATGIPKIIDFGIARTVGDTPEQMTALTELGQLIGTLQYMSPEQIAADPKAIDQRTDVYALGVILYELLTGKPPYEIRHKQIFEAAKVVREQKPVSPAKLNQSVRPDLVKITGTCLQKDRNRRYSSAVELANALGSYLGGAPVPQASRGMANVFAGAFGRWSDSRSAVRWLRLILPLLAVTAIAWWWMQRPITPASSSGGAASVMPPEPNPASDFKYDATGNAVKITGFLGKGPVVRIPDSIEDKPVTLVGQEAFRDRADLTKVYLPAHLITLEGNGFFNCTNLAEVIVPEGLLHIHDGAFAGTAISSLTIPASVITIGDCLYAVRNLRELHVHPDNRNFAVIDGVLYDKSVKILRRCPPLMKGEVVVPQTVETIVRGAFAECAALDRVVLPDGLKTIDIDAFAGCRFRERLDALASDGTENYVTYTISPTGIVVNGYQGKGGDVRVPDAIAGRPVIAIDSNAFDGQATIRSVVLPPSVEGIGNAAFNGCSGMESISMPASLTGIGFDAFHYCARLRRITIPPHVSVIVGPAHCFLGCTALEEINVDQANTSFSSLDGVLYDGERKTLIMCPAGKKGSVEIPATVTSIEAVAFRGCDKLETVVIPESVTKIDENAFEGCRARRVIGK